MAQKFFGPNFNAEEEWARLEAPVAASRKMDMEYVELIGVQEAEVIDLTLPDDDDDVFLPSPRQARLLLHQARHPLHPARHSLHPARHPLHPARHPLHQAHPSYRPTRTSSLRLRSTNTRTWQC
ncbi:uncharacterized protein LOC110990422 isoform X2 [Acanthaster planci]|uniref:Uncharacterized protein LOC110990422 isoform X2 n=1 Tax=Acanthaster planci TaxID=133434 RepID=A0A8B8A0A9_ACAPL|nr:uncharacterized protein LOC110990422 isoform X2 [Acanthaster planci]